MKGTSHGLIGLATTALTQHITINTIVTGPEKALPFLFAYVGALLPDLDTGNSTISNVINPIKMKYIKKLILIAYVVSSVFAIIYFREKYLIPAVLVSVLAGLALGSIVSEVFSVVRKAAVIAVSAGIALYGAYKGYTSLMAASVFLLAISLSPHRGYSHSMVTVAAAFFVSKMVFNQFHIPDCSIALTIGMLSHLFADMLTERGVPLLFPYNKKLSLPLTTRTGSFIEGVISMLAATVFVVSILKLKPF